MSDFIVTALYVSGQKIVRRLTAKDKEAALEQMKDLCPRAETYEVEGE